MFFKSDCNTDAMIQIVIKLFNIKYMECNTINGRCVQCNSTDHSIIDKNTAKYYGVKEKSIEAYDEFILCNKCGKV